MLNQVWDIPLNPFLLCIAELQSKDSPHKEPDSVFTRYRAEKIKQSKETCVAGLLNKESLWKEPDSVVRSFRNEIKPNGETAIEKPLRDGM